MPTESSSGLGGPIAIREIDHVVLRVADLARMQRFYGEVLGCAEVRRQDEIGLVQLRAGSAMLDLVPVDGKLGRKAAPRRAAKAATSITSAFASNPSTKPRSAPTWRRTASMRGRSNRASAPKGRGRRSICTTRKGIRSS